MSDPAAEARPRPWLGSGYAHLVLPVPYLGDAELHLLDDALTTEDGWTLAKPDISRPLLRLDWWRRDGGALTVAVLGWYPLLLTIGSGGAGAAPRPPVARTGAPVSKHAEPTHRRRAAPLIPLTRLSRPAIRRALARITDAVLADGGRRVDDRELADAVHACRARWDRAAAAHRVVRDERGRLSRRQCPVCSGWSGHDAPHCHQCGRRFTPADDTAWAAVCQPARTRLAAADAELAGLARGVDLFPDWPVSGDTPGTPEAQS